MATYSFQNVTATLVGSGVVNFGYGAGNSKEGITVEPNEDINAMYIGADGEGMHSLKSNKSGTVTIRLMRTSPQNAQLQLLFNAQTLSSTGRWMPWTTSWWTSSTGRRKPPG
mgnify:CR=1 FL=1